MPEMIRWKDSLKRAVPDIDLDLNFMDFNCVGAFFKDAPGRGGVCPYDEMNCNECWAQEAPDAEIMLHLPNTWRGKVLEKLALDREPVEEYYDVYCPGDLFKGAPQMEDPESCLANAAGGKHDTTQCDKCWRQCAV